MILDWYLLLVAFILGIVEGLTEFLPVSSTLHMVVIGELLGFSGSDRRMILLNIVVQLGSSLSIIVVFWKDFIKRICLTNFKYIDQSCLSCSHIVLGVLPTIVLGLIFYEKITNTFKVQYMICSFILGSVLLLVAEWFIRRFFGVLSYVSDIDNLSYLQAFLIGCFQCLSLCPGFSRSGATISGGLLVGVNRYVASVFSFLLAVPIMFSATTLVLYKNLYIFTWDNFPVLVTGFLSAFLVSLCTVKIFIHIVQHVSFIPFIVYRFILAGIIYLLY